MRDGLTKEEMEETAQVKDDSSVRRDHYSVAYSSLGSIGEGTQTSSLAAGPDKVSARSGLVRPLSDTQYQEADKATKEFYDALQEEEEAEREKVLAQKTGTSWPLSEQRLRSYQYHSGELGSSLTFAADEADIQGSPMTKLLRRQRSFSGLRLVASTIAQPRFLPEHQQLSTKLQSSNHTFYFAKPEGSSSEDYSKPATKESDPSNINRSIFPSEEPSPSLTWGWSTPDDDLV